MDANPNAPGKLIGRACNLCRLSHTACDRSAPPMPRACVRCASVRHSSDQGRWVVGGEWVIGRWDSWGRDRDGRGGRTLTKCARWCASGRPCRRCVAIGKAHQCADVEMRKRGRPRKEGTGAEQNAHHRKRKLMTSPSSSARDTVHLSLDDLQSYASLTSGVDVTQQGPSTEWPWHSTGAMPAKSPRVNLEGSHLFISLSEHMRGAKLTYA